MCKKIYLLTLFFSLSSLLLIFDALAQDKENKEEVEKTEKTEETEENEENEEKNSHIHKFSEKLVVGFFLDNSRNVYNFLGGENEIVITPNSPVKTNIAVSYKFLRFQYGLANLFNDVNAYEFGKTKDFNIKLNIFIKSFRQIISYHSIRGTYLENMKDIYEDYVEGQPRKQYNNMFQYTIEGQSSFNFNPNFSHKSIDLHNEWQKKSAFSFTPYLIYSYNKVSDLPQDLPISLPVNEEYIDFNFQPRAYANLVIKKNIFFMAMFYPNVGYRYKISYVKNTTSDDLSKQYRNIFLLGTGLRLQLGYNSTYFYTGSTLAFDLLVSDAKNIFYVQSNEFISIYLGFRFTAPEFLSKAIKKAKLMIDFQ